jgi:hypothetical protein
MADTFGSMTRSLRLWVPDAPIFLAQTLIRDRYRRAAERRPWSALRKEGQFLVQAPNTTGTVTLVRGSATITGSGTAFAATDQYRQFQVGQKAPTYTITTVDVGAQTLTLDHVYGGASATGSTFRIIDAYVTAPLDFMQFIVVYDPLQNWRLRHWMTQQDLAKLDPARSSAGTPWALVDRSFDPITKRPQYELWPFTVSNRVYSYYYVSRVPDLVNDTDEVIYPLRGDVLVRGALADLCRWPGTPERPNPQFGKAIELSRQYEAEYEDQLVELERQDESMYMTWMAEASWANWPYAPMDAAFLQRHSW